VICFPHTRWLQPSECVSFWETSCEETLCRKLDTARDLVERGIVGENARAMVDLRRCAADCGCDDWQNCDHTVQGVWQEATQKPLPEARPRPVIAPRLSR
jgi:hypothetical protein